MNRNIQIDELLPYQHGQTLSDMTLALVEQQIHTWSLPGKNYSTLQQVKTKELNVDGFTFSIQFNPSRIVSSAAKVDAKSIKERKCFLCSANLPEQQKGISFGTEYLILVNPFPIFPKHLTIPALTHTDQCIDTHLGDMLDLAKALSEFVLFYNGPKCGASAPDHLHFQAGNRGFLPLEKNWNTTYREQTIDLINRPELKVSRLPYYPHAMLVLESENRAALIAEFEKIYSLLTVPQDSPEPMLNLLCRCDNGMWTLWVFPRKLHRPWQYFAEEEDNLLISPASVDLGGVFITPLEKDFEKIYAQDVADILRQISMDAADFDRLCDALE
jgi:ATP adenylyltransferase/5',5'''-P-1,P-4-tetraphosphate phosphorylase II